MKKVPMLVMNMELKSAFSTKLYKMKSCPPGAISMIIDETEVGLESPHGGLPVVTMGLRLCA